MTWAPCPHGVRTRGKKTASFARQYHRRWHWNEHLCNELALPFSGTMVRNLFLEEAIIFKRPRAFVCIFERAHLTLWSARMITARTVCICFAFWRQFAQCVFGSTLWMCSVSCKDGNDERNVCIQSVEFSTFGRLATFFSLKKERFKQKWRTSRWLWVKGTAWTLKVFRVVCFCFFAQLRVCCIHVYTLNRTRKREGLCTRTSW